MDDELMTQVQNTLKQLKNNRALYESIRLSLIRFMGNGKVWTTDQLVQKLAKDEQLIVSPMLVDSILQGEYGVITHRAYSLRSYADGDE